MYTLKDIKQLPLGTKLIVKRRYGNDELILARSGTVVDSGTIYVFIDNGNGGEILSTIDLEEIVGVDQAYNINIKIGGSNDQLKIVDSEINTINNHKYDCLRADGIPRDCDCCEGYDSRVCPPVATQYHDLRIKYNELRSKYNRTRLTFDYND